MRAAVIRMMSHIHTVRKKNNTLTPYVYESRYSVIWSVGDKHPPGSTRIFTKREIYLYGTTTTKSFVYQVMCALMGASIDLLLPENETQEKITS